MVDIEVSECTAVWTQDKDGKLTFFRQYQIFYRGEMVAEISDFNKGFMNLIKNLNPEIKVKEIS